MHGDLELVETSRFILELAAMGSVDSDLDSLLARLFAMLEKLPSFPIRQKGVISMYNASGVPVTVAQHGLTPIWQEPSTAARFSAVGGASEAACVADIGGGERALVLPLTDNGKPLGQALILIAAHWASTGPRMEFTANLARALSGLVARCIMGEALQLREVELEDARTQAIRRLGTASEYRDSDTGMHVMRMANISVAIAKAMGLPAEERELLFITAPMHDIGKIGIADAIILKPGKLTEQEFDVMKTHTEIGERLLHGSDSLIEAARDIALTHHENWDGSGYPKGLKGEDISVLARICSIADVFDALTSRRSYKEAWSVEQAVGWIQSEAGRKFDPAAVAAFEEALPEILRIIELYREDIINPKQTLKLPEMRHRSTRWVSWDASLSVGIDVIDEHHRYLFDLTNDLINVIVDKRGAKELLRVLGALGEYAQVHFRAEERMMTHYGYEGTERQRLQHERFQQRLRAFHAELHGNLVITRVEVMTYLREWLVAHILQEDTQLRSLVA